MGIFSVFGMRGLPPHGYCLLWDPALVWTHVVADALIAAAYFSIPLALIRFVTRRRDIAFSWVFWLFALFIVACGATHVIAIWTLWVPVYGVQALVKVVTALASVATAVLLWPLIPRALAIPSPAQLRLANEALAEGIAQRDEALALVRAEVAEREKAEEALVQAQKMEAVGQLTGGIAHDFNNLLQGVQGMLALIARSPEKIDKVRHWAEQGLAAAERGSRLTGQLLAFSRVQRMDLKPVGVQQAIDDMMELIERSIGPDITIRTAVADPAAQVVTDRTQLELALLNLAINARDAMPAGGTLTIGTMPATAGDGEAVDIYVEDDGTGMPADVAARAFEPFFTTKGVGKGTGLGLSMVYGVARQSGGAAWIHSVPGEGTRVTLRLNRAPGAAAEAHPAVADPAPMGRGETVLVVDDDDVVRATLAETISSFGYRVVAANGGDAALVLLDKERPAAAVLDFAMPGMNGAELAQAARARHPDMRVIFASGFADSAALEAALGPGAPLLHKPFDMVELARMLQAQLR